MQSEKSAERRLTFSGFEWRVKAGARLGPGPNRWEAANVRLDASDGLRLAI